MYSGPVIDCDVHHARSTDAELIPYLSRGWREYVTDRGPAGNVPLTVQDGFPNPHGFMRADTYPKGGGEPGSDYPTMRDQLLAASDVRRAILTFGDDSHLAGHHNPYFAGDAESLKAGMAEAHEKFPDTTLEVQRVFEEGDLVAVHSRVQHAPDTPEIAVVHIFRFEGDRIAELWDIGQEAPKDSPNENGMF